jgi:hypothetical protein
MPLKLERSVTAAFPCPSGHRQQTCLFHLRYRQTTRRMVGVSSNSRVQDASRRYLFGKTALIKSAVL